MATELEAKFKVNTHEPVRESLKKAGATHLHTVIEENHILDRNDGALHKAGSALRVRGIEVLAGNPKHPTLTFKGPKQKSKFKSRQENEVVISSSEETLAILKGAGFNVTLYFEKRRETWKLDNCLVELDEVPVLGTYVEIEGSDEEAIAAAQKTIGLEGSEHVSKGYVNMLAKHCQKESRAEFRIAFDVRPIS